MMTSALHARTMNDLVQHFIVEGPDKNFKAGETRSGSRPSNIRKLQRLQEGDQLVFLSGAQRLVTIDHALCLTSMAQNSVIAGKGRQIMHQPVSGAQAP